MKGESVIVHYLGYPERTIPQIIKLSMFFFIFSPGIPSQYQISFIKNIFLGSFIKCSFDFLLMSSSFLVNLFSGLLNFNELKNSSLYIIGFFLFFLQKFQNSQAQLSWKDSFCAIYHLEGRCPNSFLVADAINP